MKSENIISFQFVGNAPLIYFLGYLVRQKQVLLMPIYWDPMAISIQMASMPSVSVMKHHLRMYSIHILRNRKIKTENLPLVAEARWCRPPSWLWAPQLSGESHKNRETKWCKRGTGPRGPNSAIWWRPTTWRRCPPWGSESSRCCCLKSWNIFNFNL